MTKFVVVHKPNVVEIPDGDYKTVGDLVAAIRKKDTELLGSGDHLTYTLSTAGGENIALNGPKYDPGLELPQETGTTSDIHAHMKENYQIRYRVQLHPGKGCNIETVTVHWTDSVAKLKERIERQSGIPAISQVLRRTDTFMYNNDTLFWCALSDNDLITLGVTGLLKFYFKNKLSTTQLFFLSSDDLFTVLTEIMQLLAETSSNVLFEIGKASGAVDYGANHWLQDRSSLFELGDAQGTMLENGILDGDEIRVYKKNPKPTRGRDA
ncbi:hypothetical protein LTR99_002519 [Exophiala xenobiotica]|uniref:Ubiquitin-like domain-containing protein n=1 Tax=Vermiconidia calcicola TaxID=1690605 RepID=A0AAV9QG39_9PEZI|nr:hypothetical protein H2202_000899 [Exophiala xenobiotica]KAK5537209.1 hypothetical protein LTR23_007597 [Chaetothyriales sp. CCFEE 6169]KAK5542143.1 hypothetical protein LTR25_002028 [Vermiconidia calcicola]KAK5195241.1 hypothetical protein LTR92_005371 [Exophiala xenobiotica]KAK5209821.1 hypothetical protein LTR41_004453 [Exophiala xenobiotica]